MKNKNKVIVVSMGLIILGIYYFYKHFKQNAELAKEPNPQVGGSNTTPTKADWNKTLKMGSVGKEVETLQTALKQLKVDGNFGASTQSRLKTVMKVTETSINQYNNFIKKK